MAVLKKEASLGFRTTLVRKRLYQQMAETEGLRLSEWLRRLADRRVNEVVSSGQPPEGIKGSHPDSAVYVRAIRAMASQ